MNKPKDFNGSQQFFKLKTTIVFLTLVVLFLFLAPPALALESGLEYGTFTGLGTQDIRITIMKIVRVLLGFVGTVAILIVLYGGYTWMTSAGNAERIDKAKKILTNAAIGLLIIFLAFAIVSFIIGVLQGALGPGRPPGGGGGGGCTNCGHLGSGIIEYVYPVPRQRDVARNTNIVVKFKVPMNPSSIIDAGHINSDHVTITSELGVTLDFNAVQVSTVDNQIFVFNPDEYLGDGVSNVWYTVNLSNDIERDNGDPAFADSLKNFFAWEFEIGIFLDLDPVEVSNVFPQPDDEADTYAMAAAVQARGSIEVNSNPAVYEPSETSIPTTESLGPWPNMSVSGTYNCLQDTYICVAYDATTGIFTINPKAIGATDCSPPFITVGGLFPTATMPAEVVNIGCNIELSFDNPLPAGGAGLWTFEAIAEVQADTLQVDGRLYTFVNTATAGNEIEVGGLTSDTAVNIRNGINTTSGLRVNAPDVVGSTVSLIANLAGVAGNLVSFRASDNWANLCNSGSCDNNQNNLSGGSDSTIDPVRRDLPDKARNAVINIDFNEGIDATKLENSAGDPVIIIEYDHDPSSGVDWRTASGSYLVSNGFKSVDFIPENACLDSAGNPIVNSCGDTVYCLPVVIGECNLAPNGPCINDIECTGAGNFCNEESFDPYEPTHYRVTIKAGLLKDCGGDDGNCLDSNFNACVSMPGGTGTACQGSNPVGETFGINYPEARMTTPEGIIDLATNSFNGNYDFYDLSQKVYGKADGPFEQSAQDAFSLNDNIDNEVCSISPHIQCPSGVDLGDDCGGGNGTCVLRGDDLIWEFYINKNLDLSPPNIEQIEPVISGANSSLTLPLKATFDELLMSSTVKPGSGYQDGYCYCTDNSHCNTGANEVCDTARNKCVNTSPENQRFCARDNECITNQCTNKKYVTLIDFSTSPVGWWAGKENLDTVLPYDGYADQTRAVIRHTRFAEVTRYGGELGSGIKDSFQNCYLPSQGPGSAICSSSGGACSSSIDCASPDDTCVSLCDPADTNCCLTEADIGEDPPRIYCCNGVALAQDDPTAAMDWERSSCFTGY